jgi:hypothetical protein
MDFSKLGLIAGVHDLRESQMRMARWFVGRFCETLI